MKRKILTIAALVSFAAGNAFAMEIVHGKLLYQKSWSTNNIPFSVKEIKIDPNKMRFFKRDTDYLLVKQEICARAHIENSSAVAVGALATIRGNVNAFVQNRTQSTQTYTIVSGVCADKVSSMPFVPGGKKLKDEPTPIIQCAYQRIEVQLDPDGYLALGQAPQLSVTYANPGLYSATAGLMVLNNVDSGVLFETDDSGDIEVTAAPAALIKH